MLVVATSCRSRWWLSAPLYSTLLHTHWNTQKLISTVCFCRRTPPIYSKISHPQNNPFQSKVFVVFIIFSFFFKKFAPFEIHTFSCIVNEMPPNAIQLMNMFSYGFVMHSSIIHFVLVVIENEMKMFCWMGHDVCCCCLAKGYPWGTKELRS